MRVQTEEDETIEFILNRSTAYYEAPNCGPGSSWQADAHAVPQSGWSPLR